MSNTLAPDLLARVLARLAVKPAAADLFTLQTLIEAYVRAVPWESAFRICRRSAVTELSERPRWPTLFWQEALEKGAGGTCFESNYAFQALLASLGYKTYLTINNMADSIGCHSAVVVELEERLWLADVGIPLYAPLELDARLASRTVTPLMTYTAVPEDRLHVRIEREPHPHPYVFTLVNTPVSDAAYRAATSADYGPEGLFLDRLIVNKVIGDRAWRFDSTENPPVLASFAAGERFDDALPGDVAAAVAHKFGMDEAVVRRALHIVKGEAQTYSGA